MRHGRDQPFSVPVPVTNKFSTCTKVGKSFASIKLEIILKHLAFIM